MLTLVKALYSGDLALGVQLGLVSLVGGFQLSLESVGRVFRFLLGLATNDDRLPQGDRDREECTRCAKRLGHVAPVGDCVSTVKFDGLLHQQKD